MGWLFRGIQVAIAKQYIRTVESPLRGVPGIVNYMHSRRVWIDQHVKSTCQADGSGSSVWQVVSLGCGYETRGLRLLQTDFCKTVCKAFEVDTLDIVAKKKKSVELLCARFRELKADKICYVGIDWNNPSALIPTITTQGFDPMVPSIFIVEGLLPHLRENHVDALLSDISALCAPGSRLIFDFLHADAFESLVLPSSRDKTKGKDAQLSECKPPGFANLASACRNKGSPFMSGQPSSKSYWTKTLQPLHFRINKFANAVELRDTIDEGKREVSNRSLCRPLFVPVHRKKDIDAGSKNMVDSPHHDPNPQYYSLLIATKLEPRVRVDAEPSSCREEAQQSTRAGGLVDSSEDANLQCTFFHVLFASNWWQPLDWLASSISSRVPTVSRINDGSNNVAASISNQSQSHSRLQSRSKAPPPSQEEPSQLWSLAAVAHMARNDQAGGGEVGLDGNDSAHSGDERGLEHALSIPLPASILRKYT
jgi:methyltransferase (TIGR00027 family)